MLLKMLVTFFVSASYHLRPWFGKAAGGFWGWVGDVVVGGGEGEKEGGSGETNCMWEGNLGGWKCVLEVAFF